MSQGFIDISKRFATALLLCIVSLSALAMSDSTPVSESASHPSAYTSFDGQANAALSALSKFGEALGDTANNFRYDMNSSYIHVSTSEHHCSDSADMSHCTSCGHCSMLPAPIHIESTTGPRPEVASIVALDNAKPNLPYRPPR